MDQNLLTHLAEQTEELKDQGLYKAERVITSPQQAEIQAADKSVINLCSNNYLGLSNHPTLIEAAEKAARRYGFGMSSVRFICGTQDIHKELESRISSFLSMEDTILYSSCFDANAGLFETILGPEDAVISDALNHASIIDGIRLCKAKRFRYKNRDMTNLEEQLAAAKDARFKLIATDGVFSMDGYIAPLQDICELAEKYQATVMVDDSHAVGFIGDNGSGTPEYCGVQDKVDIITGTLGKALGGASGGYTSGKSELVDWLRQRSRPYLFSNTLAPIITAVSIEVIKLLEESSDLRQQLSKNSDYFRKKMASLGFKLLAGEHPIIPVMLGDAKLAGKMADELMQEGVYVTAFSFPVVPKGEARIRTQMSAGLTQAHLDKALSAFEKVGKKLEIIS